MKRDVARNLTAQEVDTLFALYSESRQEVYIWTADPGMEFPVLFSLPLEAERWLVEMAGLGLAEPEDVAAYEPKPIVEIDTEVDLTARFWLAEYVEGEIQFRLKRRI
jgi:hypothetical protein